MTSTEDLSVDVHYAPGERPICGAESSTAVHTYDPAQVRGCQACLEEVQICAGCGGESAGAGTTGPGADRAFCSPSRARV